MDQKGWTLGDVVKAISFRENLRHALIKVIHFLQFFPLSLFYFKNVARYGCLQMTSKPSVLLNIVG